jgi:tripartite-type tricarboxylate transporter receptor subunit TctC
VHVPFKGGPEILSEIIAGRIDFFLAPVGNALSLVQDGKLTALVVNSAERSAALPHVPTTAEAGFRDAEYPFWIGMFVPAKHPAASSTGRTGRRPRPWRRLRCATNSSRWASSRCR